MKKFISITLILLVSIQLFAQQKAPIKYNISGKIVDKATNQPLEYATIIIQPLKTKKVTGGITNQKGEFAIEVAEGEYNITIEFISF
ncbi:MAG: carboxypeptidase-like regulatory domain-containing protein, partial [Flavobacteriaceae bacterium]|nr:carboxypeptidase-like regulatory domain-containing protein [Flavobacteriaceae bacterium]